MLSLQFESKGVELLESERSALVAQGMLHYGVWGAEPLLGTREPRAAVPGRPALPAAAAAAGGGGGGGFGA